MKEESISQLINQLEWESKLVKSVEAQTNKHKPCHQVSYLCEFLSSLLLMMNYYMEF